MRLPENFRGDPSDCPLQLLAGCGIRESFSTRPRLRSLMPNSANLFNSANFFNSASQRGAAQIISAGWNPRGGYDRNVPFLARTAAKLREKSINIEYARVPQLLAEQWCDSQAHPSVGATTFRRLGSFCFHSAVIVLFAIAGTQRRAEAASRVFLIGEGVICEFFKNVDRRSAQGDGLCCRQS